MKTKANAVPVARCGSCGRYLVLPAYLCPGCGSSGLEQATLDGEGALATYTIIRTPPLGFADQVPYTVGIVELKEAKVNIPCRLHNDEASNEVELNADVSFVERKDNIYWFELT